MSRLNVKAMEEHGVSAESFLQYHVLQMEIHRYLLSIDQSAVGRTHLRNPLNNELLPIPRHPERGVLVILDAKGCSLSQFYEAWSLLQRMVRIDTPNYYASMERMLIVK